MTSNTRRSSTSTGSTIVACTERSGWSLLLSSRPPITISQPQSRWLGLSNASLYETRGGSNLMMVGSIAFLDSPVDRDQLLVALRRRLLNHPRFSERLQGAPIGPPSWVPDALFELSAHVHRIALP